MPTSFLHSDADLHKALKRLIKADPRRYVECGRFTPPERSDKAAWAHPAVAHGKLYLWDQGVLLCYDVKQK